MNTIHESINEITHSFNYSPLLDNPLSLVYFLQRLEELEEKLKQSQFKQYLAQSSYPSQNESQVERPYSVSRDPYPDPCSVGLEPVYDGKSKFTPVFNQNKAPRPAALQVMYYDNKTPRVEKKGQFNITKKRKLYNEKDFQDF